VDATIRCSSGTYIRALARDLGRALETGGHLTALRRTAVGPYTLAQAHTLETLETQTNSSERPLVSPGPTATSPGVPDGAVPEAQPPGTSIGATDANESPGAPWVTPLAEAAAAAFPRLDLTAADARTALRAAADTGCPIVIAYSVPAARYLGLVHGYDRKPKRRLVDVLISQGLQANQDITFLTDGGEAVRALTELISPCGEHVLDWFHITMRITVLSQYARGVAQHDEGAGSRLLDDLQRIKWLLWHGNTYRVRDEIDSFQDQVDGLEVPYANLPKFVTAAHEFAVYIAANADSL